MQEAFGKSDKADLFRHLYFGSLQAQRAGDILQAQTCCLQLQVFLEQEAKADPSNEKYTQPMVAWCLQKLTELHNSSIASARRTELCNAVREKCKPQSLSNASSSQAEFIERLSETPLLAELLSQDLDQKLQIALLRKEPELTESRRPLEPFNGRQIANSSPLRRPSAQTKEQEAPKASGVENDVSSRWKRKRLEVPAHQKDFYTCSPDDFGSPDDHSAKHGNEPKTKGNRKNKLQPSTEQGQHPMVGKSVDGGFATAKAILVAEQQATGKRGFGKEDNSSGSMFPDGNSASYSKEDNFPGKRGAGLRKTQQPQNGPRGAFVPPFVKKAMQDPKDEQAGPLSAKTLELLGVGEGELPEALQKLDPNILELVCNEILDTRASVSWDDIAGQEDAKDLVQELVVWPMLNPHLFTGARAPPRGLLLFGPPGTGKTLIGRAIASNIKATFFNISASSLTSKWIGEGEKMVRALFAVAHALQPAVIFMDEIDSVLSARKAEGEHEASRRLKTELLVQMEGVDPSGITSRILLVGATNRPEELDEAARRRMPKQLYIPLPCEAARESMLRRQLGSNCGVRADLPEADIMKIVARTKGYSGSDMRNLIQEASQGPVRDAVKHHGAGIADLAEADLRPVILKDFQVAARAQRASVEASEITRYEEYDSRHGARYAQRADGIGAEEEEDW